MNLLHHHRRRAAALALVLWAVFLLSASIIGWMAYMRQTLIITGETYNDSEARAMAHSGISVALHPLVTKETPALREWENRDPGFRVTMVSEGAKLNINTLLIGEDPRRIELFKRWLEWRGIEFNDRERMVDCMLDWVDADNLKRLNGQEDDKDYVPANRGQFTSVEEIERVAGTEPLTSQSGWKDDLTVYSQGTVDLTSADFHVLRLLPGLNDAGIERFLLWRRGADGVDGTLDDPPFTKLDQAQPYLGVDKKTFNALGGLIGVRDNTWRITSEGWAGKVVRQTEVVVVKGSSNPKIWIWNE